MPKTEDQKKEARKVAQQKYREKQKVKLSIEDILAKKDKEHEKLKARIEVLEAKLKLYESQQINLQPVTQVPFKPQSPDSFPVRSSSKATFAMTESEMERKKFDEKRKAAREHALTKKLTESDEDLGPRKVTQNKKSVVKIIDNDTECDFDRKQELEEIRKMFADEEERKANKKQKAKKVLAVPVEMDDSDDSGEVPLKAEAEVESGSENDS